MQIQLLIGRDDATGKLAVTYGDVRMVFDKLSSVPNDVKPDHCMLTVDANGTLMLHGLNNLVYVDGKEILSKSIQADTKVCLGTSGYVLPLSNIISDITALKAVWNRYDKGNKRLEKQQKNDKILLTVVLPTIISLITGSLAYILENYRVIFMVFTLLGLATLVYGIYRIKTDNSNDDKRELENLLRRDYKCPNCGNRLGVKEFDKLIFSNCETCKTMFFSSGNNYGFNDFHQFSTQKNTLRRLVILLPLLAVLFVGGKWVVNYIKIANVINQLDKDMIFVEGGTFNMGAPEWDKEAFPDERPAHSATVHDFYICKHEVTQKLWYTIMGYNPSNHKGDSLPVENVSYHDCLTFIAKLNTKTGGIKYRLPTEEEWEYAARGGNKSRGYKYAGSNLIKEVAWFDLNSVNQTHNICGKNENELKLYDMNGNVNEWCQSIYNRGYVGDPLSDSAKAVDNKCYVMRGGSYKSEAKRSRITYRNRASQDTVFTGVGFRLVK